MRAKLISESLDFERNRDPKRALDIGLVSQNRDPNKRLENFKKAFPKAFAFNSTSAMSAPGSHPIWQIVNASWNNVKGEVSLEKRKSQVLNWFETYTDFDIVEIDHANERTFVPGLRQNPVEQTDQMITVHMRNKEDMTNESLDFERDDNPHKKLRIGKYLPEIFKFKDWEGKEFEIEVIDNTFMINDVEVKLKFIEEPDGQIAEVSVDGEKSEMNVFFMSPAEYEFFVPKKPHIQIDGKYKDDPNQDTWSKTESAYGYPLVDKNDKKKLKEMKEKYGYWYVGHMDYSRDNKNPFIAVAQMILFTY